MSSTMHRKQKTTLRIIKIEPITKVVEYRKGQTISTWHPGDPVGSTRKYEVVRVNWHTGELSCREL